jgi:Arc/MetJ-type ribon-helix-helix transcriptional regulator
MTTQVLNARLPKGDIKKIDEMVDEGIVMSRSDFIRMAVRNEFQRQKTTGASI